MAIRNYFFIFTAVLLLAAGILAVKCKRPRVRWLRILVTTVDFILIFALAAGVILFPGFRSIDTTGAYAYASATLQLDDASREEPYRNDGSSRKLSAAVYYPIGDDIARSSCPLVVFSHGGISYKDSNASLYNELASHGYVVVSIDHTYQSLFTTIDGQKIWIDSGYMRELQNEDSNKDIANSFACYQKWMGIRTADIRFVMDAFIGEAAKGDNGFYSLIDVNRIAAVGHSLGGAAALGVARQRSDIKAVIALEAPYLYDITGYDGDRFTWNTAPYGCAILNIYSDSGYPLIASDNKYEQNKNHLMSGGSIAYYYMKGSNHYTLTDLVRSSPALCALLGGGYSMPGEESLKAVNERCLAFLERYL